MKELVFTATRQFPTENAWYEYMNMFFSVTERSDLEKGETLRYECRKDAKATEYILIKLTKS